MTIETAMVFALGFVVAALLSLALMGAVWRRAVRLTRRRVESAMPLSMAEVKAEKDQVRAEYALHVRRAEIAAEKLSETVNARTVEIARRTEAIRDLNTELDARAARIAGLEGTRDRLQDELAAARQAIAERDEALAGAAARASEQDAALQALGTEHQAKVAESDGQRVEIVALRTRVENQEDQIGQFAAEIAAANAELAAHRLSFAETSQLLTGERRRIADVRAELQREREDAAGLRRDLADARRELAETATALGGERRRIGEAQSQLRALKARLAAEEERAAGLVRERDRLEAALAEERERAGRESAARGATMRDLARVEGERDRLTKEIEAVKERHGEAARRLQIAAETAVAEKNVLEGSLAKVREDRTRIQRELAALARSAETEKRGEARGAAALRSKIDEVAVEVARVTALLEGPASPIERILAENAAGDGGRRTRGDLPLAERIRAALHATRDHQAAE